MSQRARVFGDDAGVEGVDDARVVSKWSDSDDELAGTAYTQVPQQAERHVVAVRIEEKPGQATSARADETAGRSDGHFSEIPATSPASTVGPGSVPGLEKSPQGGPRPAVQEDSGVLAPIVHSVGPLSLSVGFPERLGEAGEVVGLGDVAAVSLDERAQQWVDGVVELAGVGAVQVVVVVGAHDGGAWQAQSVLNAVVPQVVRGLEARGVDRGRFTVAVRRGVEGDGSREGDREGDVVVELGVQPVRPRLEQAASRVLDQLVEEVGPRLRRVNRPTSDAGIWQAYQELPSWHREGPTQLGERVFGVITTGLVARTVGGAPRNEPSGSGGDRHDSRHSLAGPSAPPNDQYGQMPDGWRFQRGVPEEGVSELLVSPDGVEHVMYASRQPDTTLAALEWLVADAASADIPLVEVSRAMGAGRPGGRPEQFLYHIVRGARARRRSGLPPADPPTTTAAATGAGSKRKPQFHTVNSHGRIKLRFRGILPHPKITIGLGQAHEGKRVQTQQGAGGLVRGR
jgi:hypothetical protein